MKKVLIFGTFDVLHQGHFHVFREAKKLGDSVIAVLARDSTVKKIKARLPVNDEKKRLSQIKNISTVDEAVLGDAKDKHAVIKKIKPDVICLGHDQKEFTDELDKKIKGFKLKTVIVRLKKYEPLCYKKKKKSFLKRILGKRPGSKLLRRQRRRLAYSI